MMVLAVGVDQQTDWTANLVFQLFCVLYGIPRHTAMSRQHIIVRLQCILQCKLDNKSSVRFDNCAQKTQNNLLAKEKNVQKNKTLLMMR